MGVRIGAAAVLTGNDNETRVRRTGLETGPREGSLNSGPAAPPWFRGCPSTSFRPFAVEICLLSLIQGSRPPHSVTPHFWDSPSAGASIVPAVELNRAPGNRIAERERTGSTRGK